MHLIGSTRNRFFALFFIKKVNAWELGEGLRNFIHLKAADLVPSR